ncbi:MAG: N-acyl-D-amino acid deacylase, partial [Rufibacter sp.]
MASQFQHFLGQQQNKQFDLLIKGGHLIDGTGKEAFKADILVRADSIAFIGEVDPTLVQVQKTIDATGKVVTPGFIDMHAHGNPLGKNGFKNFLAMGATTVALGQDGSSPDELGAWMKRVENAGTDVNIVTFVGHGTIRMNSGIKYDSLPSQAQL